MKKKHSGTLILNPKNKREGNRMIYGEMGLTDIVRVVALQH
jgi:hypothetical protein